MRSLYADLRFGKAAKGAYSLYVMPDDEIVSEVYVPLCELGKKLRARTII